MRDDPLPPDVLADALQDKAHLDVGIVRPAKAVRLMPIMDSVERGLRQAERGELHDRGSFAQYADEPENVMEEARVPTPKEIARELRRVEHEARGWPWPDDWEGHPDDQCVWQAQAEWVAAALAKRDGEARCCICGSGIISPACGSHTETHEHCVEAEDYNQMRQRAEAAEARVAVQDEAIKVLAEEVSEQDVRLEAMKRVVEAAQVVTGIPVVDSQDKARIDALLAALADLDTPP